MPVKSNKDAGYQCCHCGKTLNIKSNFAKSYSDMFIGTKKMPVCKVCLDELLDVYTERYKDQKLAMQRICMAFDIYYNETLYNKLAIDRSTLLGNYIRSMNMTQFQGKTFDTTLQEGFAFKKEPKKESASSEQSIKEDKKINPKDVEQWGDGLSSADYDNLNNHYKFLKNANPNCDSNQEIFIIDLCYIKMQQMKAIRESRPDDYSKMAEQYRKSFSQAGLKTVRDASADEDFTVGVNIETIEKYTPAEYYKNKSLHKDHDDLGDYIERFCLRPLRNLMHGTTDRDFEFYVKEEEDIDEFTDE